MKSCLVIIAILFLFISSDFSQEKHDLQQDKDETFHLHELGAFIIKVKNNIRVQFLAPEDLRLPAYKSVDLKKDDIIIMANGKSLKGISELKETYENLKIGNDLKLEVKRGAKTLAVNIKKADPKDLPQKKTVKKPDIRLIKDKVYLQGLGVQIGKINEKPMVEKIYSDNAIVKKADLKGGDVVTNINGQQIKSFDQFKQAYDSINPGQDVNIKFGNKSISFKKSEFKGYDDGNYFQFH
jgi:S1-C subfamily serine protease